MLSDLREEALEMSAMLSLPPGLLPLLLGVLLDPGIQGINLARGGFVSLVSLDL
jgi:hypothetical protein